MLLRTNAKGPYEFCFSPDGHWIAVAASSDGAVLCPVASPERSVTLEIGSVQGVGFFPDGTLVTAGSKGVYRWPIRRDSESELSVVQVGPPEKLPAHGGRFAIDRLGRHLALCQSQRRIVFYSLEGEPREIARASHRGISRVDLTPNGEFAVTSNWHGDNVRVWDVATGELRHDIDSKSSNGRFVADGKRFVVTNRQDVGVYDTLTGERLHFTRSADRSELVSRVAPMGAELLIGIDASRGIKIFSVDGMKPVAELATQPTFALTHLEASPSGSIVAATGSRYLQIFDLARIRDRIRASGLDWEPPLAADAVRLGSNEVEIRVDYGGEDVFVRRTIERWRLHEEGILAASRVIELVDDPRARAARAELLELRGAFGDAEADYQAALAERPGDRRLQGMYQLARARATRDQSEAMTAFQLGVSSLQEEYKATGDAKVRRILLRAYREGTARLREAGLFALARDSAGAAVELDGADTASLVLFVWLWCLEPAFGGMEKRALESAETYLRLWEDKFEARRNLGAVLLRLGRLEDADAELARAEAVERTDVLCFLRAVVDARLGRSESAARNLADGKRLESLNRRVPALERRRIRRLAEAEIAGK